MKMKLKKETKHTCVYEAENGTEIVPVRSVYVDKVWLVQKCAGNSWPKAMTIEVMPA